jgi:hypothetical protein
MSVTWGSSVGSIPPPSALHVFAARDQRLRGDERRDPDRLGVLARTGHDRVESPAPGRHAEDLDVRDHAEHAVGHFLWTFITLSTMISAATPSAMPNIETPEMKEMKPLRRVARPARV